MTWRGRRVTAAEFPSGHPLRRVLRLCDIFEIEVSIARRDILRFRGNYVRFVIGIKTAESLTINDLLPSLKNG